MDWRRAAIRRLIACIAVTVIGVVIAVTLSDVVGWTVFAVGTTLLVALAFYEVGLSEDRERSGR